MGDAGAGVLIIVAAIALLVVLFIISRQFMLWYFRINERTDLLRDIRDSLRERPAAAANVGTVPIGTPAADDGELKRWVGESDDNYNSRLADAMQRQRGS